MGKRPRERLLVYGAVALSTAELVAILLRVASTGETVLAPVSRLLSRFGGLPGLVQTPYSQLAQERGVGEAQASQEKAAVELARRLRGTGLEERAVISNPRDVANLVQGEMAFLGQERLRVVLVNTRTQVVAVQEVYHGTVNTSHIRPAEAQREALLENCLALIVVHNHPSGDPTPSDQDVAMTQQVVDVSRLLDIDLLDTSSSARGGFLACEGWNSGQPQATARD